MARKRKVSRIGVQDRKVWCIDVDTLRVKVYTLRGCNLRKMKIIKMFSEKLFIFIKVFLKVRIVYLAA